MNSRAGSIRPVYVVTALFALGGLAYTVGQLYGDPAERALRMKMRATCKEWVAENLDLDGLRFSDYEMDFIQRRVDKVPVEHWIQFAHRECGVFDEDRIVPVSGGFPCYFSITLDGSCESVIDHYADYE